MQKTAQRRGILNKLREKTNLGGMAAENIFSPEFRELMDRLRDETDDPVRAILSGTQIGNASPPSDAISLKDLMKDTKSAINRREYMKAVANLGRFHKKLFEATKILSGFKSNVDSIHEKFLLEGLDDDSKQHLHDLKGRIGAKAASTDQKYFIKEANIMDFFSNIGTERGRALAAWEKTYPKQVGKLKGDTIGMLRRSESVMANVLSILKDMATARATRNVDKYLLGADKIVKLYNIYDMAFKEYYNANVKGFLEKHKLIADAPVENPIAPEVSVSDSIRPGDSGGKDDFAGAPGSTYPSSIPSAPGVPSGIFVETPTENSTTTDRVGPPDMTDMEDIDSKSGALAKQLEQQLRGPAPAPRNTNMGLGEGGKGNPIAAPIAGPQRPTGMYGNTGTVIDRLQTTPPSKPPSMAPGRTPTLIPNNQFAVPPPAPKTTLMPRDEFGAPEEAPRQDVRKAHQNFYSTLESMGQTESPTILGLYIKKYAASIQHTDLTTALKLFELSKSIKE